MKKMKIETNVAFKNDNISKDLLNRVLNTARGQCSLHDKHKDLFQIANGSGELNVTWSKLNEIEEHAIRQRPGFPIFIHY